ncbi:MAG TPA: MFS transporter [Thermoleophilaceae bacterium]
MTRTGERTLAVVGAATLLVLAVFSMVVATIGDTVTAFGATTNWQTWALGGMSLGLASALLTTGALADRFGRRRVFVWSSGALALATAVGAAAPSMAVFVAARVLQGAAGAGVLAAGLGLLGHAFPDGHARTRATGIWGATLGAGIAIGPIAAALLARTGDWRTGYWVFAAAAAVLAGAALTLSESRPSGEPRPFDPTGAVAIALAMTALTAGLTSGRSSWSSATTIALLVGGVAALGAFVAIEHVRRHPMLDLDFFRRPLFVASVSGAAITGLATVGLMSHLIIVIVAGLHRSVLAAAAVLAFWSVTSTVVAFMASRLPARFGATERLVAGLTSSGVGALMLADLGSSSSWTRLVPGLAVMGIGSGLANAALGRLAVASVPHSDAALGSGANNTARYLGSALGIALVAILITGGGSGTGGMLSGWDHAAIVGAGLNVIGAAFIGSVALGSRRRLQQQ